MNTSIDDTHSPELESWLESTNDPSTDFPIQNLPFGRFRRESDMDWAIGVAIGDQVLDLRQARVIDTFQMNRLIQLAPEPRKALRQALSAGLRQGSAQEATGVLAMCRPGNTSRSGRSCRKTSRAPYRRGS